MNAQMINNFKCCCEGDDDCSEYLLDWLAQLAAGPSVLVVSPGLKGRQGAGKTLVWGGGASTDDRPRECVTLT